MLLGKEIHIIRIFHLIKYIYNFLAGKSHTQSKGCTAPSLTHRIQDDDVWEMVDDTAEGSLGREITVSLIHDDDAVKQAQHFYDGFTVDVIARRIVRTTEPDNLGIVIAGIDNLIGCHLIVLIKQHLTILHIIDVGTYLIHAVGRSDGYNIVLTRTTEHTVNQVDSFV